MVQFGGQLTIEGTGTVDNVSHQKTAVYNSGTVVLNGGTYDRSAENGTDAETSGQNSYYTILNHGTMTINDGVTVTTAGGESNLSTKGRFSSLIDNGYYNYNDVNPRNGYVEGSNAAAPSLIINGGTFTGGLNTIKNDDGGSLTISGGTFNNFYQALVQNHNVAEIKGGTFKAASDASGTIYGVDNCGCDAGHDIGTLTISGGTFSDVTYGVWDRSGLPAQVTITGGSFTAATAAVAAKSGSNAEIAISGGTFSSDVSDYVAAGYVCKKANDQWEVSKLGDSEMVVKPDNTDENTVSATLDGTFSSDGSIEDGSTTEESSGTGISGKDVTVDLTTSVTQSSTTSATLNITAETAKSMAAGGATLTVQSDVGTVSLPQSAVAKMESADSTSVTVSITKNNNSTDDDIKVSYTVEVKANDKNLLPEGAADNGTITITVDKPAESNDDLQAWYAVENNGSMVYVEKLSMQDTEDGKVAISIDHLSTIVLTNGTPSAQAAAAVTTSEGQTTYYADFDSALSAAASGGTVALLADVTLDGTDKGNNEGLLTITKDIILEGNGKTITAKNVTVDGANGPSMINIQDGANVTVRNLTIDGKGVEAGSGTPNNTKHGLNVYGDDTTVTVENVTIKNGNGYGVVINGAEATINGLTTENNGWGGINVDSKSGAVKLTIKNAAIGEENSVKIENSSEDEDKKADPEIKVEGGSFQYITKGDEITKPNLTIAGGRFATGTSPDGAIDVKDHLDSGLSIDSSGNVYKPSTGGGGSSSSSYAVSVSSTSNGSVSVSPKNASKGNTVTITVTPDTGYELAELTVTDKNGDAVKVTDKGDGKYTFTMPASKVTVKAAFVEINTEPETPVFTDVSASAYYYNAVLWAVENGVTEGTGAAAFSPDMSCTRAQMVTFLWRGAGSPEPTTTNNPFTDVQAGSYYYDAVLWAVEQGITSGTSATTFSPDTICTRAQAVTFLWRANNSPAVSGGGFADVPADAYYTNAVAWAVSEEITNGTSTTTFSPDADCTRAQIVTLMYRAAQ